MEPTHLTANSVRFETVMGTSVLRWSDKGLTAVWLPPCQLDAPDQVSQTPPFVSAAITRIQLHLAGKPQSFADLPVDLSQTPEFSRRVYERVKEITAGSVLTYGDVARELGKPGGARAVGHAMSRNPLPLVVPCHRVVAKDGGLGGFSAPGGVQTKQKLLDMEGATLPNAPAKLN